MSIKNSVTISFTTSGKGSLAHFQCPLGSDTNDAVLGRLLQEALRAGAVTLEEEWYLVGFGPTKWTYRLDLEVLRDLMLEAGYNPSVG